MNDFTDDSTDCKVTTMKPRIILLCRPRTSSRYRWPEDDKTNISIRFVFNKHIFWVVRLSSPHSSLQYLMYHTSTAI